MQDDPQSLVSVRVLINGSQVEEGWDVYKVQVSTALNWIASAEIWIIDGDVAAEDFPLSEGKELVPGNEIEIQAGFGPTLDRIFRGVIVSQTVRIQSDAGPMLIVRCKDYAIKMSVGRNSGAYLNQTDDAILRTIAGRSGLSIQVDSTPNTISQMVQYATSDWDFLIARAEMNGLVVVTTGDGLEVRAPRTDASPAATLTLGVDIVEIESTVDALTQLKHVQAHGWDFRAQVVTSA